MKLNDLFWIEICKNPISRDYALENPGTTPYITTTSENNGIECYVDYPAQYHGGVLTVSKDGGNGDAFFQKIPFCGNEKVMVLTPKQQMSDHMLFYYVAVIRHNKHIFGYGRKCSVSRLADMYIPSPDEIPNYVNSTLIRPITTAVKGTGTRLPLLIEEWAEFRLADLFSMIYKAEAHVKANYNYSDSAYEDSIRFISRTEENNGCDCYIANTGLTGIEDGRAIVIGDTTATCSYQATPFVCGDHIVICRADWINTYTALFIVTLIKKEQYKYSYGRAFKMQLIAETKIKLPAKDGKPDWAYMENYIKSLPYGDRI